MVEIDLNGATYSNEAERKIEDGYYRKYKYVVTELRAFLRLGYRCCIEELHYCK